MNDLPNTHSGLNSVRELSEPQNPTLVANVHVTPTPPDQPHHSLTSCISPHGPSSVLPEPMPTLNHPSSMKLFEDGEPEILHSYLFQYYTSKREPSFVDIPIPAPRPEAGNVSDELLMNIFRSPNVSTSYYYNCFLFNAL